MSCSNPYNSETHDSQLHATVVLGRALGCPTILILFEYSMNMGRMCVGVLCDLCKDVLRHVATASILKAVPEACSGAKRDEWCLVLLQIQLVHPPAPRP